MNRKQRQIPKGAGYMKTGVAVAAAYWAMVAAWGFWGFLAGASLIGIVAAGGAIPRRRS